MKPVIAANWKMNLSINEASQLIHSLNPIINSGDVTVIICPSACYLKTVAEQSPNVIVGAQNISDYDNGAYTGEISAKMIKSCGAKSVIIGHSERRHVFNETNEMIEKKIELCNTYELMPILCVGETLAQRNNDQVFTIIEDQLLVIESIKTKYMIAYEPVWAIGTGETATPEIAQEVHRFIRKKVGDDVPILYGGSVNSGNVDGLLQMQDINGALVGGASLKVDEFTNIIKSAESLERTPQ